MPETFHEPGVEEPADRRAAGVKGGKRKGGQEA